MASTSKPARSILAPKAEHLVLAGPFGTEFEFPNSLIGREQFPRKKFFDHDPERFGFTNPVPGIAAPSLPADRP